MAVSRVAIIILFICVIAISLLVQTEFMSTGFPSPVPPYICSNYSCPTYCPTCPVCPTQSTTVQTQSTQSTQSCPTQTSQDQPSSTCPTCATCTSTFKAHDITFKFPYKGDYHANARIEESFAWAEEFWTTSMATWEPATFYLFGRFIRSTTTYIGAGEWMGPTILFACQFAERCIGAEPDPFAFTILDANIKVNKELSKKITLSRLCLSNEPGSILMNGFGGSGSKFSNPDDKALSAYPSWQSYCIPLKSFILDQKAETDDLFIKIDTEDAEKFIIPPMYDYLMNYPHKHKPMFFLATHDSDRWTDEQLEGVSRVIGLYEYVTNAEDVKYKAAIFRKGTEITPEFLKAHPYYEYFMLDRNPSEYPEK